MFDDLPKHSPLRRFSSCLFLLIVLGGIGYFGYQKFLSPSGTIEPKVLPTEITDTYTPTASPSSAQSFSQYLVPAGETFVAASASDTNGDNAVETLVVTRQANGNYHAYVLSMGKTSLFEHKDLIKLPIRVSAAKYRPTEAFPSWELILSESQGDLFFIHWNGTAYEIPKN